MSDPIASLFVDFRAGTVAFEKDMKALSRSLAKTGRDFGQIGENLTKAVSIPLAAGAVAMFKAVDSFQKAQKTIQTGTGATGDALKGLKKDFEAVAKTVPNSFGETAKALSDVNVRTGATGEAAQKLTKMFLELSNVTGTDLNANLSSGLTLFDAWGVAAGDQAGYLDKFYRASQIAGTSVTSLMETVGGSDAILGAFGFSLDESIGLVTNFARGGIDAEKVFGAFNKAMINFSKAGVPDAKKALLDLLGAIEQTPFSAEVATRAAEVFGSKIGVDMIDAAQEGRFAYGKYLSQIKDGDNTILGAAEDHRTFGEAIQTAINNVNVALGQSIDPKVYKELNTAATDLGEGFAGVLNWAIQLPPVYREIAFGLATMAAAVGPVFSYLSWVYKSGAGVVNLLKGIGVATRDWAFAQILLSSALSQSVIFKVMAAFSKFGVALGALALPLGAAGLAIVALAAATAAFGGDFMETVGLLGKFFYIGFVGAIEGGINIVKKAFNSFIEFASEVGSAIGSVFSYIGYLWEEAAVLILQAFGLSEDMARSLIEIVKTVAQGVKLSFIEAFSSMVETARSAIDSISSIFSAGLSNWQRGLLVIKYGGVAAAIASDEYKQLETRIASLGKTTAGAGQEVYKVGGVFSDLGSIINEALDPAVPKIKRLPPPLDDVAKAAEQAEKALAGMVDALIDKKASHEIDKIKDSIGELAKAAGSNANFGTQFENLENNIANSYFEGFKKGNEKATQAQLDKAQEVAKESAAYDVQIYKEDVLKNQLEADKDKHTKSVNFLKGLMEDVISGTRFDWVEQGKKAAIEIAAEWATRLLQANALGAKSFGSFFDIAIDSLGGAMSSWLSGVTDVMGLGDIFGGAAGGPVGGVMTDAAGNAIGSTVGGAAGTQAPATIGGIGVSSLAGIAAAAAVGYIVTKSNIDTFSGWNSQTTGAKKTFDVGTAGIDTIFPGLGTGINKIGSSLGLFGGDDLTKNQESIKSFAKWVEDALKKSFGKALNFVVGDIGQFERDNWADDFWGEFRDVGGMAFTSLGSAFEKILGLEKGVGGQLGALLANNLAGATEAESLDNIKLFMDSLGISVAEVTEAVLQMGLAGELSWLEFESMRQSLEQIPVSGLAAFGDITGALDQVLESGGRGIQAINGLKNIAVEAGEAGVTSFDQLKEYMLNAGYAADVVSALFQGLGQRGIDSLEGLSGASDSILGGVIADMEVLGVRWDDFGKKTDQLDGSIKNLADTIKDLTNALKDIPTEINTEINISQNGGSTDLGEFARGGVVWGPHTFKAANGIGLMGEAGPEAIMPLAMVGGKLGVHADGLSGGGSNYIINIDATGAQAGMEHKLLAAMQSLTRDAVVEAAHLVSRQSGREVY